MRPNSLQLQVLAFLVLPLLILLTVVAAGGVALHSTAMYSRAVTHNAETVQQVAAAIADQLDERQAALSKLVDQVADHQLSPDEAVIAADWLQIAFDDGIVVYAPDGSILAASSEQEAHGTPVASVDPLLVSVGDGGEIIRISAHAADGTQAVGLVSLEGLKIAEQFQVLHLSDSTSAELLSASGEPIYMSNELAAAGRESDLIVSSAAIEPGGWTLVHREIWVESLSPLLRYSQAAPLVLVPGALLAVLALWYGANQIVRPLHELETQATRLAWGDFESLGDPVGGIQEIAELQRTLQHMARQLQAAQMNMRQYIGVITQTQEEERLRLARELHDQTIQSLVALGHRQHRLTRYLNEESAARDNLDAILSLTNDAVEELRRIIRAMRPIYLDELGLAPALEMLTRDLSTEAEMRFQKEGAPRRLPPEQEVAVYRIAQEALNNARQHADAHQIDLDIRFTDDAVVVTVHDDGAGFAVPQRVTDLSSQGHFGLMGMYERASLCGGRLEIQSTPGEGTTVSINIPQDGPTIPST